MSRTELTTAILSIIAEHPGTIQFPEQLANKLVARIGQLALQGPGTGYRHIPPELDHQMDDWGEQ